MGRIELPASPLPRECSATELHGRPACANFYNIYQLQRGAGEGNRTLVLSLEGFSSTIELHPQNQLPAAQSTTVKQLHMQNRTWWREKDSNLRRQSRQIYSLIPLATWVSLQLGTDNFDAETRVCQKYFRAGQQYSRIHAERHHFSPFLSDTGVIFQSRRYKRHPQQTVRTP
jgi:hypothetical protein